MIYDGVPCNEFPRVRGDGYGVRYYKGKSWAAHRAEWDEKVGPIPEGIFVLHHCDNKPCREIKHLFLGTHQDNMDDKVRKGRQSQGIGIVRAKNDAWYDAQTKKLEDEKLNGKQKLV